ncbi:hypothetical protein BWQ96_04663 [Gracilariopsis chorda]|uniref:Uncharacterized protein n=1 Tax=Gracilariopsis chorda TaxID=448386 RepID=A0A2V3ITX9_9FLOR|nr:hypothetical protein BWQ96_04663 [Gracilariopsis chorda]|eukprot:PXF45586.1 hypothetical protein BWQ96_04663 [Gracilariopsis chorda]
MKEIRAAENEIIAANGCLEGSNLSDSALQTEADILRKRLSSISSETGDNGTNIIRTIWIWDGAKLIVGEQDAKKFLPSNISVVRRKEEVQMNVQSYASRAQSRAHESIRKLMISKSLHSLGKVRGREMNKSHASMWAKEVVKIVEFLMQGDSKSGNVNSESGLVWNSIFDAVNVVSALSDEQLELLKEFSTCSQQRKM